jgi:hypothetical protein
MGLLGWLHMAQPGLQDATEVDCSTGFFAWHMQKVVLNLPPPMMQEKSVASQRPGSVHATWTTSNEELIK